jgi:DNA-binding NtrC family response regulator
LLYLWAREEKLTMTTGEVRAMDHEKARVLVVDDEEVVRQSYERSLAGVSCTVRTARGGQDAIQIMEEGPCDVVLVDLRMPGMNGIELLREIKDRWPESEVVVITGYPTIESAKEAVKLGAFNYLAKPVGPKEVIEVATRAMVHKGWSLKEDRSGTKSRDRSGYRYPWEH